MYKILDFNSMAYIEIGYPERDALKSKLTLRTTDFNDKIKELVLYTEPNKNTLGIPRNLIPPNLIPYEFLNRKWDAINFNLKVQLRERQNRLVNMYMANLKYNPLGGILCAKTGTGKSIMGLSIASKLGLKTLIVVPLTSLVDQWTRVITEFTDIPKNKIGIIQADKCNIDNKDICIGMLHTLSSGKYTPIIKDKFGTVIFDEVHKLGAEYFSYVAMIFNSRYRIGLSATPYRKDNMDNVFLFNIGNIIAKDDKLDIIPQVIKLQVTTAQVKGEYMSWSGKFNLGKFMTKLSMSDKRNEILLKLIKDLYKSNRNVLVLCDRVAHVRFLQNKLKSMGIKVGVYIGEEKSPDKIIIATHGSCGIGVDLPYLDTLIFASPRADIEQPVGRILRQKENKKQPLVIDLIDVSCKEMVFWSKKRDNFYKKINAIIKTKIV